MSRSIFFTADIHAGHRLASNLRGFGDDISSHDQVIVDNINNTVDRNDALYIIGDICLKKESYLIDFVSRINVREKHLIIGNHDEHFSSKTLSELFVSISHYKVIKYNGMKFVMMHYPIEEWQDCHRGSYHLHGHVHSNEGVTSRFRRYDVGIDNNNMMPVHIERIVELLAGKEIKSHH
jgi:calcineurin-like phosphoesterase family protein